MPLRDQPLEEQLQLGQHARVPAGADDRGHATTRCDTREVLAMVAQRVALETRTFDQRQARLQQLAGRTGRGFGGNAQQRRVDSPQFADVRHAGHVPARSELRHGKRFRTAHDTGEREVR